MPEKFEPAQESAPETKEKGKLTFRDLRIEDCDDMVEVVNDVVDSGAPIQRKTKTTREEWLPVLEKILENVESGKEICVAAEKEGHVVGWLSGMREKTDVPVVRIYTAILARGGRAGLRNFKELAGAWFAKVTEQWPDTKKIETTVNTKNPALNLYKRFFGFKETGEITTPDGTVCAKVERLVE
jgi:L-amino acid N-acyltransferase YncA